ncbi:PREDICTED: proteoglycan 3 [Hipposideros armiger]|uniref:Proteoglycan 3 n=1 Tax=Hipposideros armiger TaxID=186990 RepID=A0A8B7PU80_HIPAR|nr:PREDICTED: proteoglycan 3 [Hipposideros armiger]
MRPFLLLPLLLLGAVSALHPENDALYPDSRETQGDLSQDLEGSGEQKGELALTKDVIQSEGEADKSSRYPNAFEDEEDEADEEDEESDPSDLEEDFQCPREEDTVQMVGSPGCRTCHYTVVRTPRTFRGAQNTCQRCYHGNLVSIHSITVNIYIQHLIHIIHRHHVWIGGRFKGQWLWRKLHWTDGSSWNFVYWASGQPKHGKGNCVTLSTRGGHWRRAHCKQRLPFICHFF